MRLALCSCIPQQYAAHCFPFRNLWTLLPLRLAICNCFPQYNCTHQNFKEKLCPELDGPRAETAPRPLRTHRLTPLAFAPPRTPIYCENTGIRALPYFQTATLSHACHVLYFQPCTLSHACHVTELFKCELPVDWTLLPLRLAICNCFPQYNCTHQNFKEKLCPELDGPRAETAPRPLRTHRLTPLAFAPPRTPIYCENTGIRTLPYFQTATLSHACHVLYFQPCTLSHACHVTELLWATSWLLYHLTELLWATSWLLYHLTALLWATSWLLYHLTELLWATSWLLYHYTELLWATSWLLDHVTELLWATSWLLYHLTELVSYLLITLPLD